MISGYVKLTGLEDGEVLEVDTMLSTSEALKTSSFDDPPKR